MCHRISYIRFRQPISYTLNPEIFARILFPRIALKDLLSLLGYDLHISVVDRVISPFREDFIFTKPRIYKTLAKISEFTVLFLQASHTRTHAHTHTHTAFISRVYNHLSVISRNNLNFINILAFMSC